MTEGRQLIVYGDEGATFERSCPKCGRLVKADAEIVFRGDGQPQGETATCAKCGRVKMPFVGYV